MVDWIGILNYIRGDVCCIFILLYLMFKSLEKGRRTERNRYFIELIVWMLVYILMYSISGTFKYGYFLPTSTLYNIVVMFVMISQTMVAYRWFCYSELQQNARWIRQKSWQIAVALPAVLFCLMSVLSIWTKWIFFIDSELVYHRGKLFVVQYVIVALYMFVTSLKALSKSRKKENYIQRKELFTLFTFIVPPSITTALQSLIPMGVFMVGYGFTISILMIYINGTNEKISQDGLTRLNNRTHMSHFLNSRMFEHNERLYLLILDANSFKGINDNYGHVEGDKALLRIARALTAVAHHYSCYISRYGGDEFIVIQETDSEEKIQELCRAIQEQLRIENEKAHAPYELSVSIGYAKYQDSIKTIPDFIQAADEQLLLKKSEYHGKKALS